jgi:hypothetical protein
MYYNFTAFNNASEINDYLSGDQYMNDDQHKGLCFGFTIDKLDNSHYSVKLFYNDHK